MARQRYDIKEAWNRILRSFQGTDIPSDQPGSLSGEILSVDEALSDLAELFEGSLPNQTLFIPNSTSFRFGEIYAESITGTSQSLVTGTWTLVTGFSGNGLSSDGVTPDQANDRITLNLAGTYFIHFGVSFEAPNGTLTQFHFEPSLDGVRQGAVSAKRGIGATGAIVGNVNAAGFVQATAGQQLQLEVLTEDAARILHIHEMQMNAKKVA